ncbi:MAG TPA: GNAT family N-acetyltransferase [Reyranella sp.]|nr:GNAT family N-acetyltransferase [Reyranella sp.]
MLCDFAGDGPCRRRCLPPLPGPQDDGAHLRRPLRRSRAQPDLRRRGQRRGIGSRLFATWVDAAARRGARAFHVGVNRANAGAVGFWRKQGFEPLATDGLPEGRTLWMGCDIR